MSSPWYKRHWARLKAESIIIAARFPQFVLKKTKSGQLFWEGILITNFKTRYLVNIMYPVNYPYEKPVFRIIKPKIKNASPHLFANGTLCVYPDRFDHKRCTAPAGVPLVASWLAMYEIWLRTGRGW
jgi:hypothetical protein